VTEASAGSSEVAEERREEHAEWRVSFIRRGRGWVGEGVAGVLRIQARGKVLGGEKGVVLGNWEDAALLVEMVHGGHTDRACADTEGCVLNDLKLGGVGVRKVGCQSGTGIVNGAMDESLVGCGECLFVLTPGGAGERTQDIALTGARGGEGVGVVFEG